jgi:hypothetical protein
LRYDEHRRDSDRRRDHGRVELAETVPAVPADLAVKCEACGEELPALARSNRRYCDARCRRRAFEKRHADEPEFATVLGNDEQVREVILRATSEDRLVAYVASAARTNWRASAWLLERRYPERWAPVRRVEPDIPAVVADDPFREIDELAAKRRAQREPK